MAVREGMMLSERYEILSKIGTGGMSDVYKAVDHTLNRFVAIKVLKNEFAENRSFVSKFWAEAQAAAGLIHPNIVNVYDVGTDEGLYYIVMELVEGITLKHYIEKKLRLSVKESISIAIQVSMGLECAHSANIIHRDVKPQNIMISKDGKVKVTDFAIARAATSDTITSNVMGSVHYTSPEQARGGYSDEKSDIYSIGIVLFEMLTGRVPFDGDSTVSIAIQHIQDTVPSPRNFVNDVPISVEQIIFKCCEKSPDRRYSSMTELIADLKQSLLTPDDNFVKLIPSGGFMGATQVVTQDDMRSIKNKTGSIDIDESLLSAYNRNREPERNDDDELLNIIDESRGGYPARNPGRGNNMPPHNPDRRPANHGNESRRPARAVSAYEEDEDEENAKRLAARQRRIQEEQHRSKSASDDRKRSRSMADEEDDEDDDMDPTMQKIMRIMAVVIGIVLLVVIIIVVRKFTGSISVKSQSEDSAQESTDITIEDVTGQTFEVARQRLTALGFIVQSENQNSSTVAAGSVISQVPAAGTTVAAGSTVTLVVSAGVGSTNVPDVMGKTYAEAKVTIEAAGFSFAATGDNTSGVVTAQNPTAGTASEAGTVVTVAMGEAGAVAPSAGEGEQESAGKVIVPNLVGLSETAAKTALTASQLAWTKITEENSDTVAAGMVISQSIPANTSVDSGTSVDFVLSLGPVQTTPVTPAAPAATTYGCNFSITAPSDYTGGQATVVLTGDTTGTVYFSQSVTAFPVAIKLSGIAEGSGKVTVNYTVVENGDDNTVIETMKTQEASVSFTAEQ
ncbi:MAG: protein kinase [Lachnospiraceae bacterium]|nr:protein kinase [Lachnospiraceae bacterium]